jgi:hypothetical protein
MGGSPKATTESGVVSLAEAGADVESEVTRACHDIIDAASIAVVNLDFASEGAEGEKKAALDDAQYAVARIVQLVTRIRRVCLEGGAGPPSTEREPEREPGSGP